MTGEFTAESSTTPVGPSGPTVPGSLYAGDHSTSGAPPGPSAVSPLSGAPQGSGEATNPYRRMEQLLAEIRAHLDASARESQVREFSLPRLTAALLQALVVGLVFWAMSDWVFGVEPAGLWIKLGFAVVLELGAIAALLACLLAAREKR